jgi:hypothetical protein
MLREQKTRPLFTRFQLRFFGFHAVATQQATCQRDHSGRNEMLRVLAIAGRTVRGGAFCMVTYGALRKHAVKFRHDGSNKEFPIPAELNFFSSVQREASHSHMTENVGVTES